MPSENFSEDAEHLESFVREQWVASKIDHPSIMKLADKPVGSSPFLYHAFEYIEGKTLRQWMYDNPKPELERVRIICEQITSALRVFQRLSMVHRDLKPENIMLDVSGRVKIIDFGAVQVNGLDEIASPLSESVPVGAVDYIAPEYLLGEKGRYRSDLFSLGVIAYEMLTGALPYQSPRIQRVTVRDCQHWQYRSATSVRKDIPLWLDLALQKATMPKPSHRYAALSEFLQDLKTPNRAMLRERESAPLLARNPLAFWKWVSGILCVLVVAQFWLLVHP
jgi:protein phosphatase